MNAKILFDIATSTSPQYAAGDLIGSMVASAASCFANGSNKTLKSITVHDLAKQSVPLSLIFADAPFNSTTFTDNSALDIGDSDLPKVVGVVSISHTNYQGFADNSVATLSNVNLPLVSSATGSLYMAVATNGSPTYASTSDLRFELLIADD